MSEVVAYTDGSCNPINGLGAWASIILVNGERASLTGTVTDTTHQRMELLSVIKTIEYVRESFSPTAQLTIYSDSQYVVEIPRRKAKLEQANFTTGKGKDIRNLDLVRILLQHLEGYSISICKVKAHEKESGSGNINREVDKLVRKTLRSLVNST